MSEETKAGMQCQEFDALLSEALDGSLNAAELQRFDAHRASCPSCGPMFAEAQAGMKWLHELAEVEPPRHFVHNVLAATIGLAHVPVVPVRPAAEGWWPKLREAIRPRLGPVLQPKFAMSFAMAFFSISVILNFFGIKSVDLRHMDLRPTALYYAAEGRVLKYYDNIRFVYEIQTRVQQLKRATTPEEGTPPKKDERKKEPRDSSGQPDLQQYQNYSREMNAITLAQQFVPDELKRPSARRMS
ncbi:MAG: anti-sigma factor family protein [Terriglobales bacterium]